MSHLSANLCRPVVMHSWHRLTVSGVCFPDDGYKRPTADYTECIIVAVLTAVLLVFSVVGSVYVFRGHWVRCALLLVIRERLRQPVCQLSL